jgi:hypothetical protein
VFEIRTGSNRRVLLTKHYVVKLPRLRHPGCGMRSNRWERELWSRWRPLFPTWEHLCPVLLADPFGLIVVMPRARAPDDYAVISAAIECDADCHPQPTVEYRADEYGVVGGRVVCFDYGVADADMVREKRDYYAKACRRANY